MGKKNLLLSSLFFSFTLGFFAPVELYLTNKQEFWFDTNTFIGIPIIVTIAVFLLLLLPAVICSERAKSVWTALVFSSACLMYVQGNFLNKNVGIMNGMLIEWEKYRLSFLLNWGIWVVFATFILIWYSKNGKYTKKIVSYVSLFVLLIQCFTVSVLFIMDRNDNSDSGDRYLSMKNVYDVSSDENIIVFIMDMFDDRYFDELIATEPQYADAFDGFTQYTNFTGVYGTTRYTIGHLLTGEYLLNQKGLLEDDIDYMYENTVVFDELEKHGYNLDVYTYDFCIPHKLKKKLSNYCDGRSKITSYPEFAKNIYSLAACKYLPDFFKQHCWLTGNEFESLRLVNGEYLPQSFNNADFYHALLDKGLSVESDKEFKFVHLNATHYPYTISENVEELGEGNATLEQTIKGSVKIVQEYINEMKECGVYDKSSIIIMADHGYYQKGLITNPLLLVKPRNTHGKLQFSDVCISQKDFQATLLSLAGLNDNMKYGYGFTDVDEGTNRERYYYQYVDVKNKDNRENRRLIEYKIDPDNNNRGSFHITGNEYNLSGEKVDHVSICSVCQQGNGETDSFDTVIIHE